MDDEVKGEGNSVNYRYRMHDPRVGRFFAVDPLERSYPYYSPYQFSGNRPIDMVELEGLETGNAAGDYLYWAIWGYVNKLKGATQEGVKDMIQGDTKSNEYINNNPVYSQQTKDNLHSLQKLTGALQITAVALDPALQTMNFISPVDDILTVATGKIHDLQSSFLTIFLSTEFLSSSLSRILKTFLYLQKVKVHYLIKIECAKIN